MSDFAELITTIEQVRAERYPQLSAQLVRAVLEAETTALDNRNEAAREIRRLVAEALSSTSEDTNA